MNHFDNIHERVKALEVRANDECEHGKTDMPRIVRDLAAEVALLAKLMAERHRGTP